MTEEEGRGEEEVEMAEEKEESEEEVSYLVSLASVPHSHGGS